MGKDFSDYYRQQAEMEETALNQRNAQAFYANQNNDHTRKADDAAPYWSCTPPPSGSGTPAGGAGGVLGLIAIAVIVALFKFGVIDLKGIERDFLAAQPSASSSIAPIPDSSTGWGQGTGIDAPGQVAVSRSSPGVWLATGEYRGHRIRKHGHSPAAALWRWRKAAARLG
jgi:hypothetical protein